MDTLQNGDLVKILPSMTTAWCFHKDYGQIFFAPETLIGEVGIILKITEMNSGWTSPVEIEIYTGNQTIIMSASDGNGIDLQRVEAC